MSSRRLVVHEDEEPPRKSICGYVTELLNPKISGTQNIDIATVKIEPGKASTLHYHKQTEEIYYMVKGTSEIQIDDLKSSLRPGHATYIPRGARHTIKNTSNESLVFVVVSSPPLDLNDVYEE